MHAQLNAATGQYQATRIEAQAGATGFKLRGMVSALDTTAKTFQVQGRSETISHAATVTYKNGTEADLANGAMWKQRSASRQTAAP